VTFNYSGYPMVRELRNMIRDGRMGTVQQIHVEMPQEGYLRLRANPQAWRRKDHEVPTVSLDLGVHVHHLVDFLTDGNAPMMLTGEEASYGQFDGLIDNVYCLARYQDNLRLQAWWGKTALGHRNGLRIRIFGSQASAEWFQMDPETLQWSDNEGRHLVLDRGTTSASIAQEPRYNRFKAGHPSGFIEAFANLYADIAADLRQFQAGQVRNNDHVFGARHAMAGLEMMESLKLAAQQKKWLTLQG
jgi:predicted dehydrogenase